MNAALVVPALFFAAIAIVIIGYSLRVLSSAIGGSPAAFFERSAFKRKQRLLSQVNAEKNSEGPERAIVLCRSAFFIQQVRFNFSLIDAGLSHNLTVLGRLVGLAERRSGHLANLPVVESLLSARADLMKAHFEVLDTIAKLKKRQRSASKGPAPEWAMSEFQKKRSEIQQKIASNGKALEAQLDELVSALQKMRSASEITYH